MYRQDTDRPRTIIEERTGSGTRVRIEEGSFVERPRSRGVVRQNFYSSPRLKWWFVEHDIMIDNAIREHEERERQMLIRQHQEYLRNRRGKTRAERKAARRAR